MHNIEAWKHIFNPMRMNQKSTATNAALIKDKNWILIQETLNKLATHSELPLLPDDHHRAEAAAREILPAHQ